jgi:hypothetical protein
MSRKLWIVLGLALLASASSASAQVWTSVATGGTVETSTTPGSYSLSQTNLTFNLSGTGNINSVLNVTDPKDIGSPAWTTLEFTAKLGGANLNTFATATLYRVPKGSASVLAVCTAIAPNTGALSTSSCTFSSSLIDFNNNNYFVRISLGRDATQAVAAYGVRVF